MSVKSGDVRGRNVPNYGRKQADTNLGYEEAKKKRLGDAYIIPIQLFSEKSPKT